MLKVIGGQFVIIVSFVLAFTLRIMIGHFPNESPLEFIHGYLIMLFGLCIFYFFLFWILGYYERKTHRAVLEEILGVWGVITLGAVVLLTGMYLRKDLWVSRGIIFEFWLLSTLGISLFHILAQKKAPIKAMLRNITALNREIPLKNSKLVLGIVIVNKDSLAELKSLLASLKIAEIKCLTRIAVVDNGSNDGSQQYLGEQKEVLAIRNEANIGYSRGVNQGMKALPGCDYYLILNPDIVVPRGAIEAALNAMGDEGKVGLSGCKLLNQDGTLQYSARTFYSLRTILYRFTPLRGLLSGSVLEKEFLMMNWDHNDSREVDWVLGGCMLVREKAIKEVGLMDGRYFMYFDDVDWCYRMWEAGWKVQYLADSIMIHRHRRKSANDLFSKEARAHLKSLFIYLLAHKYRLVPKNCPSSLEVG